MIHELANEVRSRELVRMFVDRGREEDLFTELIEEHGPAIFDEHGNIIDIEQPTTEYDTLMAKVVAFYTENAGLNRTIPFRATRRRRAR